MTDECVELKNIKYQNMLLNKNSPACGAKENVTNMDTKVSNLIMHCNSIGHFLCFFVHTSKIKSNKKSLYF